MRFLKVVPVFLSLLFCISVARAEITSVTGPASNQKALPAVIAAPSDVLNDCITGEGQLGFNEAQGVVLTEDLNADDGVVIPAGTIVDSHMIFLNETGSSLLNHLNVVWSFDRPVIAVMSDSQGNLEAATTAALGAGSTNYTISPSPNNSACRGAAPFSARGMETTSSSPPYKHTACGPSSTNDCYTFDGNTITVSMAVTQPGDWIRVITQGVHKVSIDIKPGSDPNCININSRGVIPVAVLGSATFDVNEIDTASLQFSGLSVRTKGNGGKQCSVSDTNNDGYDDLVCQFVDDRTAWNPASATGVVTGSLNDETTFEGSDTICLVP